MAYLSDSIYKIKNDLYLKRNKDEINGGSEIKKDGMFLPSIYKGLKEYNSPKIKG